MFTPNERLDLNDDSVLCIANVLVDTTRNIRDAVEEYGWEPTLEFFQAVEKLVQKCDCGRWTPIREDQAHRVCRTCVKRAQALRHYRLPTPLSLTTEQLGEALLQTVQQMSAEEKAALRQQMTGCSGCGIQTRSHNRLCDICDAMYAALTRTSAACEYWKRVNAEFRREAERIRNLITLNDADEAAQ